MKELILTTRDDLDKLGEEGLLVAVRELIESGGCRIKFTRINNGRTIPQNSAIHVYLKLLAEALNDAGFTQKAMFEMLKESFDLPVTEHFTKKMWHEAMHTMIGKTSTADLEREEVSQIYKAVDQRVAELTGVQVDFPKNKEKP